MGLPHDPRWKFALYGILSASLHGHLPLPNRGPYPISIHEPLRSFYHPPLASLISNPERSQLSRSRFERQGQGKTLVQWCLLKQRHFRKRVGPGSLFLFFELPVTHGFTQRGVLGLLPGPVVSAIPATCCDDCLFERDLSVVPREAPISIFQTACSSFGLRTLSVSPKTPPRFNTPFGTASRNQP